MRRRLGLACLTLLACGCEAVHLEREVYGHYELRHSEGEIRLEVSADHSYSEILTFASYPEQRSSGKWYWSEGTDGTGRVCFESVLEPVRFKKDLYAASGRSPTMIGRTYQLDDCLPAEKEYGKTILEINPDSEENFVMVAAAGDRH
jgi:hypothetical protein